MHQDMYCHAALKLCHKHATSGMSDLVGEIRVYFFGLVLLLQ